MTTNFLSRPSEDFKCLEPAKKKDPLLKEAVSRDFLQFFFMNRTIWIPDKQSKMVLLKYLFSWRYSQKTWLRAVWYCAESDSTQYHTAPSPTPGSITLRRVRKLKCPKIQNCLTLCGVGLGAVWYCAESNNFFDFQKLLFPWLLASMWWYFEKKSKIFRKSKIV